MNAYRTCIPALASSGIHERHTMRWLIDLWRIIEKVSGIVYKIGGYCILLLGTITIVDVAGRYFVNRPLPGSLEMAALTMGTVIFLVFGHSFSKDAHIKVDILTVRLSRRTQALLEAVSYLLTLFFLVVVVWQGTIMAFYQRTDHTDTLYIPVFPFAMLIPFGCTLAVISIIGHMVSAIKTFLYGEKEQG